MQAQFPPIFIYDGVIDILAGGRAIPFGADPVMNGFLTNMNRSPRLHNLYGVLLIQSESCD